MKSAGIWSSKLIHVGFHQPFATTTTGYVSSKEKGTNIWYSLHLEVPVHIGTIYKLTLISSFIIWVRGYHRKTLKTHYEAETYLYLSQSSWLTPFSGVIGSTFHVSTLSLLRSFVCKCFPARISSHSLNPPLLSLPFFFICLRYCVMIHRP